MPSASSRYSLYCLALSLNYMLHDKKLSTLFKVDENRIEQCSAVHNVHSFKQYRSALLHLIQSQQY